MIIGKQRPPTHDWLAVLAERFATEINERAAKMTPEKRAQADSETEKIAAVIRSAERNPHVAS
jgi:hypothetical protein